MKFENYDIGKMAESFQPVHAGIDKIKLGKIKIRTNTGKSPISTDRSFHTETAVYSEVEDSTAGILACRIAKSK